MHMDSANFFRLHFDNMLASGDIPRQIPRRHRSTMHGRLGLRHELVEIPVQSTEAMPSPEAAISAGRARGMSVGAGTVTSVEQLAEVRRVGARFTVAPGMDEGIIREAARLGISHLPGVATATEVTRARQLGLTWLKAFPAAQLGTDWIKAQHGPFPNIHFVATGGITAENANAFLAAGFRGVALGSASSDEATIATLHLIKPKDDNAN
jgi:2-dehydro-3-deoxyphosphogluconate aldolase/(4S)-4-hydroxy-2-oxoglutarate aldolase